jgi:hypothetical protein
LALLQPSPFLVINFKNKLILFQSISDVHDEVAKEGQTAAPSLDEKVKQIPSANLPLRLHLDLCKKNAFNKCGPRYSQF